MRRNLFTSLTLYYSSQGSHALTVSRVTQNCLKLTLSGFLYNLLPVSCGDISFIKNPRSGIGLEIRGQSAFTVFWALLSFANYSA